MRTIFLVIAAMLLSVSCKQQPAAAAIRDGFYPVVKLGTDTTSFDDLSSGERIITFDTLFNPDEYTRVAIDTTDFVPLELERMPVKEKQTDLKNLLSISLTPDAAKKLRTFTIRHVMKHVVVVLDGKAITMHKIKEPITGRQVQITRCDDNGCDYLFVKMKDNVKR